MSLRPLLALAFAFGALGGCFLSANVPPSFRYTCQADADCRVLTCLGDLVAIPEAEAAGLMQAEDCDKIPASEQKLYYQARQTCMNGLCEYPCELTAAACPTGKGYLFCFNGACASLCGHDPERFPDPDATCSDPQSCVIFGEDIETSVVERLFPKSSSSGGSSIPGQSGGATLTAEDLLGTGVCGVRCDAEGALPCPAGQYCSGAMCLPDCTHEGATPCAEGTSCFSFGGFSTCIETCDANGDNTCDEGKICVAGLDLCLPTCLGEDATLCEDGFTCDQTLGICIPEAAETGTGTSG